jgi:cellulose biosynthesis protein BcsQ
VLNIYVIDLTAESRNRIIYEINGFIQRDLQDNFLIPRINIKPLTISEVKFHAAPDICIVGQEFASHDLAKLADLRKLLPETSIIVKTQANLENISIFEQFARLGVDDTMPEGISAIEFFKKIILLTKRSKKAKSGQLILVEGSKGGQGTTSVAAAIGEILHEQNKKVLLVDLDSETQDLSRFLLVKPFINENLQYLIDQHRPISEETVKQCILPVWQDEENLFCMPPIADSDEIYDSRSNHARVFLSIFDILDKNFDYVVVDIGGVRGNIARTLYRIADTVICLVYSDPAALYACSSKVSNIRSHMSVKAKLSILECTPPKPALTSSLLRSEINRGAKIDADAWLPNALPYCSHASKWPGSGNTMYSSGSKNLRNALFTNLQALGFVKSEKEKTVKKKFIAGKEYLKELVGSEKPALLELPSPDQLITGAKLISEAPKTDLHVSEENFAGELEPLVSNVRIN